MNDVINNHNLFANNERYNNFQVRVLLWDQLKEKLNSAEWSEAKAVLGEDIIDQSQSLQEEVQALLSIWQQYQEEINHEASILVINTIPNKNAALPEPPNVRERLEKQIMFFVNELSKSKGIEAIPVRTPRDKAVLEYVTRDPLPQRPSTSSGRDRPSDVRPSSRRGSPSTSPQISPNPTPRTATSAPSTFINLEQILQSADQLKGFLMEENGFLLEDVEFLHFCLNELSQYSNQLAKYAESASSYVPPSLQEMREYVSKLEQKYIEESQEPKKKKQHTTLSPAPHSRIPKIPPIISHKPVVTENKEGHVDLYPPKEDKTKENTTPAHLALQKQKSNPTLAPLTLKIYNFPPV